MQTDGMYDNEWLHGHTMSYSKQQPHHTIYFFGSDICPGRDQVFIGSAPHDPINVTALNVTAFGDTTCMDVYAVVGQFNSIPADVCASLRGEVGDTCCTNTNPFEEAPTIAPEEDDMTTVAPNSPTASPDTVTDAPNSPAALPGFPVWTVGTMVVVASFMTALN